MAADFTSTYSDGTQVTDRGVWQPSTSYNQNDLVTGSNGTVYIAQSNVPYSNDLDPTKDTQNKEWRQAAWNSSTTYSKNQLAVGSNNLVYVSRVDNNTGNNPTTDTTDWRKVSSDSLDSGGVSSFADTQSSGTSKKGGYQSILTGGFSPDSSGNPNTSMNRIASNLTGTASPWKASTAYAKGDVVEGSDKHAYTALVDITAGDDLDPTMDPGHTEWQPTTLSNATSNIQSSSPNDAVSGAIGKTSVPAGTSAFIDQNATVAGGGSVSVLGKENLGYTSLVGSLAAGGVGLGASVGVATIKSNTDAHIGSNATVSAGSGAGNTILVNAALGDNVTGKAYGGQAGIAALGAQVIVLNDNSTQNAHVDSGARINQAGGGVTVEADANRIVTPTAINAQLGGLALGAAVAIGNVGGFTAATMGSVLIGQVPGMSVGGLDVTANSDVTDEAMTIAASAGLLGLAANAAAAVADDNPIITASVGPGATINLTGDANIDASSAGDAEANATGVAVSTGGVLGLAIAIATLTPSVTAGLDADSSLFTTGNVTVMALNNYDESGNPINNMASGTAIAGSGALIAALAGAIATVTNSPTVNAYVGDPGDAAPDASTTISAGGNVGLSALSNDIAKSMAVGVAVAVGVGITGNGATTTVGGQVSAQLNGNVSQGVNVGVIALATGSAMAQIDAGAAGLAAGVFNLANASLTTGVAALIGQSAMINVTGTLTDMATSQGTSNASGLAYSLGLVALGIVISTATLSPSVSAGVGDDADITAKGGITVMAIHDVTPGSAGSPPQTAPGSGAFATSEAPLSLGLLASGNGAVPTATAQANVSIDIGAGSTLSSGGNIRIESDAANIAQATAKALAVSIGAAIGTSISKATSGGGTTAALDGSVSGANNLFVFANSINTATTTSAATSGAIAAGTGATADSEIPTQASTQADTGASSNVTGVVQSALVQATALNQANAMRNGNTFGLVAVGVVLTTAKDKAQTAAYFLGNFGGSSLTINAKASDNASTTTGATTGGLISASPNNKADTTVTPTVGAAIGGNPLNSMVSASIDTVTASGIVGVSAIENPEGDAAISNGTYGGVAVGGAVTTDNVSPMVTAYVNTGTTVKAGGNVSVSATATPQASTSAPTYNIQSVNTTNNTLNVLNNGLDTGQTVLYDNEGNTPIEGLTGETDGSNADGMRAYTVLSVDPNNIQFGANFVGNEQGSGNSGVNTANSTINVPYVFNLQSGDYVQYEPGSGGAPIGGLTPGGKYYVQVVSPTSIRLTNSYSQAVMPQSFLQNFTTSSIESDNQTIKIPNNGFAPGEAVTFTPQAQPQQFSSLAVNVYATYPDPNTITLNPQPGANDIYVANNPFQNGDTIVYQVQGSGNPIGGLINGHTYQVQSYLNDPFDLNDPNLIQLKDLLNVQGVKFTQNMNGDTITRLDGGDWGADGFSGGQQITISGSAQNDGTYTIAGVSGNVMTLTVMDSVHEETDASVTFVGPVVTLTPDTSSSGAMVVHGLSELTFSPLVAGNTYYVTNVNTQNGTFQLASSPQNAANGIAITLGAGGINSNTNFQIGPQGIPITSSSGAQDLAIVLGPSSTVSGTQRILGPGGVPLSVLFPTTGSGISSSSSHGSGGAVIGVESNSANVTASPTVSASFNGPLLTSGGNISITSTSNPNASAHADNGTDGLIAVGHATATNIETNTNTASVGMNSMIGAVGNVTVLASSTNTANADTGASAGAGIASVHADATAVVNYFTKATVNQNACVAAGQQIQIVSSTSTNGSTTVNSSGAGFGAGAYANQDGGKGSVIGNGGKSNAINTTEIFPVHALYGQSVVLAATVPTVAMTAYGNASGSGFYGQGESAGNFTMNAANNVLLDKTSSVTGLAGVDILPTFQNINGGVGNPASADATATGLFGYVSATANNNTNLWSKASSEAGSLVAAGPRGSGNPPDGLQHPNPTKYPLLCSTSKPPPARSTPISPRTCIGTRLPPAPTTKTAAPT